MDSSTKAAVAPGSAPPGLAKRSMGARTGDKTQWSLILRAQGASPEARAALGQLIRRYERTVVALIRSRPYPPTLTPEDIKQEFFARVLARGDIDNLRPQVGRFRGWLNCSVRNFVKNAWDKYFTISGGDHLTERGALDTDETAAPGPDPEQAYLRSIAEDTIRHVLARHREEAKSKAMFDTLQRFLPGPQLDPTHLAPIARTFGITPEALAVRLCRLRVRHRQLLEQAVADTMDLDAMDVGARAAIAAEMKFLYHSLVHR